MVINNGKIKATPVPSLITKPDNAGRPNLPMFIDPAADLAPGSGSWFVTSNLKAGDHEFGILVHYMEMPFSKPTSTIAITDVTNNLYLLDERKEGSIKANTTNDGFEVISGSTKWTANKQAMSINGNMKAGEGSFNLKITRKCSVLPYNGTGCFPLLDNTDLTWEYAFPVMETTGTVTIKDHTYNINGNSWFDRQWFQGIKASLGSKQGNAHWTWLSIKLSNGDVVAIWEAVNTRERCWANIMHPDGTITIADVEPLTNNVSDLWVSKKSGIKWPTNWTVKIPGAKTNLLVKSTSQGQETTLDFDRIEAVIHVTGTYYGNAVTGEGYAELLGDPQLNK